MRLTLASAALNGIEALKCDDVLEAAAAIEFLHEASLLHDDVVDASTVRRGIPSAASVFGIRNAALAGSFLAGTAVKMLGSIYARNFLDLDFNLLSELAAGQLSENIYSTSRYPILLSKDRAPSDCDSQTAVYEARRRYLEIARGKTGSLFRLACDVGSSLSNTEADDKRALRNFVEHFTVSFQVIDDLHDFEGFSEVDAYQTGLSWPLIEWLSVKDSRTSFWAGFGEDDEKSPTGADLKESGAITRARNFAAYEMGLALRACDRLLESPGRACLRSLALKVMS